GNLYDAVVSSQFDADRLDYMQRDRLMTGVQSSGIDLTWLLANLEVASVRTGADDETTGAVETLVLGPKATQAAESYVLSLFHLYAAHRRTVPSLSLHPVSKSVRPKSNRLAKPLSRHARSASIRARDSGWRMGRDKDQGPRKWRISSVFGSTG